MSRVFSYSRISTPQQAQGGGITRQLDMAAAWCEQHGHQLDTSLDLSDIGISGFTGKNLSHGALGRFLQLAQQGALGDAPILLIEAVDRLSRQEPMEALRGVIFALVEAGVAVVDLEDRRTYDRESLNGDGLLWLVLRTKAAHEYSSRLSRRVRASWDQHRDSIRTGNSRRRGPRGGRHPFWLDFNPATDQWVLNDRAADVAWIFDNLLKEGLTLTAQRLNARGSQAPGGGEWAHHSVRRVALDPAAAGTLRTGLYHHDKARAARHRWAKAQAAALAAGLPFRQPEPQIPPVELLPGFYPAVVSPEQFDRVGALLQRRHHSQAAAGNRGSSPLHTFLQGLVTCQHGSVMGATLSRKATVDHYYLRCRRRLGGKGCQCNGKGWRVDALHAHVAARLNRHLLGRASLPGPDVAQRAGDLAGQLTAAQQGLAMATAKLATAEDQLATAVDRNAQLDLLENLSQLIERRRGEHRQAAALVERIRGELAMARAQLQPAAQLEGEATAALLQGVLADQLTAGQRQQLHRVLQQAGLRVVLDDSQPEQLRVGMRLGDGTDYRWQSYDVALGRIVLHQGGSELVVDERGGASFAVPDSAEQE